MEKVNQQIKKEIGQIIQKEMSDPRLQFVSITHVETSKDLRHARIFFSVLGDPSQIQASLSSLNHAKGFIRHQLGKKIMMRNTPELNFVYDKSLEESARINQALEEWHNEDKNIT
ncbi:MAG: 30S ribosome-binding factor RbfA [Candidatus Omnitrophica bacterium]|nr:30S ribosome-binding factor RbfA [Candidatus Omnitrophota bacterium]